jgi:small-conductance mechanosensitive channel
MEINWRATRMRSAVNDLIIIPNSMIAKAIVRNHRPLNYPYVVTIDIQIDHSIAATRVLEVLRLAAVGSPGVSTLIPPTAYACGFTDGLVAYQLCFGIESFATLPDVQSNVIQRVMESCRAVGLPIGRAALEISVVPQSRPPGLTEISKIVPNAA